MREISSSAKCALWWPPRDVSTSQPWGPLNVTTYGKRVFADVIKDLKIILDLGWAANAMKVSLSEKSRRRPDTERPREPATSNTEMGVTRPGAPTACSPWKLTEASIRTSPRAFGGSISCQQVDFRPLSYVKPPREVVAWQEVGAPPRPLLHPLSLAYWTGEITP